MLPNHHIYSQFHQEPLYAFNNARSAAESKRCRCSDISASLRLQGTPFQKDLQPGSEHYLHPIPFE